MMRRATQLGSHFHLMGPWVTRGGQLQTCQMHHLGNCKRMDIYRGYLLLLPRHVYTVQCISRSRAAEGNDASHSANYDATHLHTVSNKYIHAHAKARAMFRGVAREETGFGLGTVITTNTNRDCPPEDPEDPQSSVGPLTMVLITIGYSPHGMYSDNVHTHVDESSSLHSTKYMDCAAPKRLEP